MSQRRPSRLLASSGLAAARRRHQRLASCDPVALVERDAKVLAAPGVRRTDLPRIPSALRDALEGEAACEGGEVAGLAALDVLIEAAESRRAALAELLPANTPDFVATGFASLFDEYERKVRQVAPKLAASFAIYARRGHRRSIPWMRPP